MRQHKRAFTGGYVLLAFTLVRATTLLAVTSVASGARPRKVTALPLISNHSSPATMDNHFDQHPLTTFPASSLGLPMAPATRTETRSAGSCCSASGRSPR
jgi:hypothetical protein